MSLSLQTESPKQHKPTLPDSSTSISIRTPRRFLRKWLSCYDCKYFASIYLVECVVECVRVFHDLLVNSRLLSALVGDYRFRQLGRSGSDIVLLHCDNLHVENNLSVNTRLTLRNRINRLMKCNIYIYVVKM